MKTDVLQPFHSYARWHVSSAMEQFWVTLLDFCQDLLHLKIRVHGLSYSVVCIILTLAILICMQLSPPLTTVTLQFETFLTPIPQEIQW